MSPRARLLTGWLVALAAASAFAGLGTWQAGRAVEKERMLAAADTVLRDPRPQPLSSAHDLQAANGYAWAAGTGRFIGPVLWLDNQQREGRVGVRAYALFQPRAGGPVLVDLGWSPIAADRRSLPRLALPEGDVAVRGLLAPPPSAGLAIGDAMARHPDGWLMLRVEPSAIASALSLRAPPAPRVLRLDPAIAFGLPRDLQLLANTLPPEKHRGYALQWFGLSATVLVIALVLTFRRPRR